MAGRVDVETDSAVQTIEDHGFTAGADRHLRQLQLAAHQRLRRAGRCRQGLLARPDKDGALRSRRAIPAQHASGRERGGVAFIGCPWATSLAGMTVWACSYSALPVRNPVSVPRAADL